MGINIVECLKLGMTCTAITVYDGIQDGKKGKDQKPGKVKWDDHISAVRKALNDDRTLEKPKCFGCLSDYLVTLMHQRSMETRVSKEPRPKYAHGASHGRI